MSRHSRQSSQRHTQQVGRNGETTSVSLNESWSGSISVGDSEKQNKQAGAFTLSVWSFNSKSNLKGIIFRNGAPIQTVKPAFGVYSANKDVLRSLKSLDSRLQKEYSDISNGVGNSSRRTSSTSRHSSFSTTPRNDAFSPSLLRSALGGSDYAIPTSKSLKTYSSETSNSRENDGNDHYRKETMSDNRRVYVREDSESLVSDSLAKRSASLSHLNLNSFSNNGLTRESSISSVVSASGTRRDDFINHKLTRVSFIESSKPHCEDITEERGDIENGSYLSQSVTGRIYDNLGLTPTNNHYEAPLSARSNTQEKYSEEQLNRVGEAVIKLADGDGQKRNLAFHNVVRKICDVVNIIFEDLPQTLFPFQFERLDDNVYFETKGLRSIEIYVCPLQFMEENFEVTFFETETMLADMYVQVAGKEIEHFFVEDPVTRQKRLSPCKMMIVFAHVLKSSLKERNIYSGRSRRKNSADLPHGAEILFSMITEKVVQLNLKFPEEVSPYEVTLVIALDMRTFPNSKNITRSREWSTSSVKKTIDEEGAHLLAKLRDKNLHSWTVSTLKARRTLLKLTDPSGNKLRVLLAFQILRETELSRPKCILPLHLAMVLFWACVKFPSQTNWTDEKIGLRFLDLLLALRRCLWRGECRDFFFPCSNLFGDQTADILHSVVSKLDNIIQNPLKYLRRRVMVSDGEGGD